MDITFAFTIDGNTREYSGCNGQDCLFVYAPANTTISVNTILNGSYQGPWYLVWKSPLEIFFQYGSNNTVSIPVGIGQQEYILDVEMEGTLQSGATFYPPLFANSTTKSARFTIITSPLIVSLPTNFIPSTISDGDEFFRVNDTNHTIISSLSGGKAPYNYHWVTPSSSNVSTSNIAPSIEGYGDYSFHVEDSSGQHIVISFKIKIPPIVVTLNTSFSVSISNDDTVVHGLKIEDTVTASASGGTEVYTYSWTTPAGDTVESITTLNLFNYGYGQYESIVSDDSSQQLVTRFIIDSPDPTIETTNTLGVDQINDGDIIEHTIQPGDKITINVDGDIGQYKTATTKPNGDTVVGNDIEIDMYGNYRVEVYEIADTNDGRLALAAARGGVFREIGDTDEEGNILVNIFNFTIVDPNAAFIFVSPTLIVDEQPVACGGLFYKFCDLSASTTYSSCPVSIGAVIRYNGLDELGYELWINEEEIRSGTLIFEDTYATISEFDYYLEGEFTQIVLYILDEHGVPLGECTYTIRRLNSRFAPKSCNIGTPDTAVILD